MLFSGAPLPTFNAPNIGNGFLAFKVGRPCISKVGGQGCGPFSPPDYRSGRHQRHRSLRSEDKTLGDGQTHLGGLHMAGVFNGIVAETVAHRARLPSVFNVQAAAPDSVGASHRDSLEDANALSHLSLQGAALDLEQAVFLNRTTLEVQGVCEVRVEQRIYAHQVHRSLLVHELILNATMSSKTGDADATAAACLLQLDQPESEWQSPDFSFTLVKNISGR
jgi:hypothetical protein